MKHMRIVRTVEDTWGKSTIYSDDDAEVEINVDDFAESIPFVPDIEEDTEAENVNKVVIVDPKTSDQTEKIEDDVISEADSRAMNILNSSLYASVLEDTILQMRILVGCNTEIRLLKTKADMGLLKALKYNVEQPVSNDELADIDPKRLDCEEYKLNKMDADCKYFTTLLMDVYAELSTLAIYESLTIAVKKTISIASYRTQLEMDVIKNKATRKELFKQRRLQNNHIKTVAYDTDVVIDSLKSEIEDSALNAEIRSRYIDGWQKARTEQHSQVIEDTESTPNQQIEYYKTRTDHEHRVHSEIELLVNIMINETLEKVEAWMDKYDKEIEAIDLKIQLKKNEYKDQMDQRKDLEDLIEKHKVDIVAWQEFKAAREKERQYVTKMTTSAIIVQAWWRGLLVRCELGPFKVAKKKGGKKKK